MRSFLVVSVLFVILPQMRVQCAPIAYFSVDPSASTQIAGAPFSLTVTARDASNNIVSDFSGTVNWQAVPDAAPSSQPMLGNIGYSDFSFNQHGPVSAGFAFTPTRDIVVTHVRHFSGGRISIWTDNGVLLTDRNVLDYGGQWLETPLLLPLKLEAGQTYRVTLWSGSARYYWNDTVTLTSFPHGLVGLGYAANSDTFPTTAISRTYLVDLRYSVGASNALPVSPASSGSFTNGIWSGLLSLLEPAQNIRLLVADGFGHSGTGNVFSVLRSNDMAVNISQATAALPVPDPFIYVVTVTNTGPAEATGVLLSNRLNGPLGFVTASPSQGSCTLTSNSLVCALGSIPGGVDAKVVVTLVATNTGVASIHSRAVRGEIDGAYANNEATAATRINPRPTARIGDASVIEGDSGTTNVTLPLFLSYPTSQSTSFSFATVNGSAREGDDYLATTGSVVFAPGTTNVAISIPVVGDRLSESNEVFFVSFAQPTNASLSKTQAVVTIVDNDAFPTLAIEDASLAEGNVGSKGLLFLVSLSEPSARRITVRYNTTNGTAVAGSDYQATNGTLVFNPGTTNQTVLVPVLGDVLGEATETFTVVLSNPSNVSITRTNAIGTIINDDPLSLVVDDAAVLEGDSGFSLASFTVCLSWSTNQPVTVQFTTSNGVAMAGIDYLATNGFLTFPAGVTSKTVNVVVIGDLLDETAETFFLNLSNASGADIADGQAVCSITNDDPSPVLSISDVTVTEADVGNTNAVFEIALSTISGRTVQVNHATANGTAAQPSDYLPIPTTTLTFSPGVTTQFVTVQVVNDVVDELDETFFLRLSTPVNATIEKTNGACVILTDEGGPGELHHFEWAALPSTVLQASNFPVNVTAKDRFGLTISNFLGPIMLLGTLGPGAAPASTLVTPSTTGLFSDGIWRGELAFLQIATNAALVATNGAKVGGSSSPFDVVASNDVRLTMRSLQPFAYPGDLINWAVTVTNPGPTALELVVSNTLPSSATFVSAASSQGGCVLNGGQVLCTLGALAPATSADILIGVRGTEPSVLTNRATVLVAGTDPDLTNNSASATSRVLAPLHHFAFERIPGTQEAGVPFPITISARDFANNVISNWSGSVELSASQMFREDFEDGNLDGWSGSAILTNRIGGVLESYAAHLTGSAGISHSLANVRPEHLTFRARIIGRSADPFQHNAFCTISSGPNENQRVIHLQMRDGNFTLYTPAGNFSRSYQTNVWYDIRFTFNWGARTVDFFVNNSLVGAGAPFYGGNGSSLSTIDLYNWFPSDTWWDDIKLVGDSSAYGVTISPTTLGPFTNGFWAGAVTALKVVTNAQFIATNANGSIGISSTFDVTPGLNPTSFHFEWAALDGQLVNQSFPATLMVRDAFNRLVTNFPGSVFLKGYLRQPVRILAFAGYADNAAVQGPLNLIRSRFTNFAATTFTNTDPALLRAALAGQDVFLIPYQTQGSADLLSPLGGLWKEPLAEFVTRGGVVLMCTSGGDDVILNNAGLLGCSLAWHGGTLQLNKPIDHILNESIPSSFISPDGMLAYSSSNGFGILNWTASGAPVVLNRDIGAGHVVLIGWSFMQSSGTRLDDILINAVRWARASSAALVPVGPTIASAFTNGIWAGTFQVPMVADEFYLAADDGHLNLAFSNPFRVGLIDDIGVGMAAETELAVAGRPLRFLLSISNAGPSTATSVRLTNSFTSDLSLMSVTASTGTCAIVGNSVQCDLGDLGADTLIQCSIVVLPTESGVLTNTAVLTRNGPDFFEGNNSASLRIPVVPPPSLFLSDVTVTEGDSGTTVAVFPVRLFPPSTQTVSVHYAAVAITAQAGFDYVPTNGTLTLMPGVTNGMISVLVLGDTLSESNETFRLELSAPENALLGAGQATCRILDNGDPLPLLYVEPAEVLEPDSGFVNVTLRARLSVPSGKEASVSYQTVNGTATAPDDFFNTSGSLVFSPGTTNQTFNVSVRGDTLNEPDEFLLFNLFNPVNASLAYAQVSVLIKNDDGLPGKVDHFELSPAPNPAAVGSPFLVTIAARDAWGFVVTTDNDDFSLTARQGRPSDRLEILSFTRFVDDIRYPTPLLAISNWFPHFHETNTTVTDPVLLGSLLQDKQVFLVPAQSYAPAGYMGSLGKGWAAVLEQFVRRGGLLVVCSDNYDEHLLLLQSGLLSLNRAESVATDQVILGTSSRLSEGVPSSFTGPVMSTYTAGNGIVCFRTQSGDRPVVIYRELGAGAVFMIGAGFYSTGTAFDQILANAIKWNSGEGVRPVSLNVNANLRLTNGLWTGPVTILDVTTNGSLLALDASGRIGLSNPFDAFVDSDGDGLPDAWEQAHGLDPNNASDAGGDLDLDGASNLEEFLQGTAPNDSLSALRITRLILEGMTMRLRFETVNGKRYQVESSDELSSWQPLSDPFTGIGGATEMLIAPPNVGNSYFFRVRLFP